MGTKIGEMREMLVTAIEEVRSGKMDSSQATAIAKLAAQVSLSLQVEANIRTEALTNDRKPLGHLAIGHEERTVDNDTGQLIDKERS